MKLTWFPNSVSWLEWHMKFSNRSLLMMPAVCGGGGVGETLEVLLLLLPSHVSLPRFILLECSLQATKRTLERAQRTGNSSDDYEWVKREENGVSYEEALQKSRWRELVVVRHSVEYKLGLQVGLGWVQTRDSQLDQLYGKEKSLNLISLIFYFIIQWVWF